MQTVAKTTNYPYTAIGYLQMENKKGEMWGCTAALIGPKTALTAANCLYNHARARRLAREGGVLAGGQRRGQDPYGGFDYDTNMSSRAYVTEYNGNYDSIWQYDIGLVTFKDPIGDSLGWLGYTGSDIGDFQGNSSAITTTSPRFTMWRSTCNVLAENISQGRHRPRLRFHQRHAMERRSIITTRAPRAAWWSASTSGLPATPTGR